MSPTVLADMTPAQREGWETLLDLADEHPVGRWCVLGGQMVWLLACEHGVQPPRATEDIDVVVDIRADQSGLRRLCRWLQRRGFELEGVSSDGIGHRYVRPVAGGTAVPQPPGTRRGRVVFDVLAPDNVGERADRTTTPPARTLSVPGGRAALDGTEFVPVIVGERSGMVPRPGLLAAILVKASATTIAVRSNPERDWTDIAFLLTLVPDPTDMANTLTSGARSATAVARDDRLRLAQDQRGRVVEDEFAVASRATYRDPTTGPPGGCRRRRPNRPGRAGTPPAGTSPTRLAGPRRRSPEYGSRRACRPSADVRGRPACRVRPRWL